MRPQAFFFLPPLALFVLVAQIQHSARTKKSTPKPRRPVSLKLKIHLFRSYIITFIGCSYTSNGNFSITNLSLRVHPMGKGALAMSQYSSPSSPISDAKSIAEATDGILCLKWDGGIPPGLRPYSIVGWWKFHRYNYRYSLFYFSWYASLTL